jgi:hypothetical protein
MQGEHSLRRNEGRGGSAASGTLRNFNFEIVRAGAAK